MNGFLADRSDIRKFMSVGLFVSELANFAFGWRWGFAGASLGVVGIASYLGAGIQDIVSGYLIKSQGPLEGGKKVYEFAHTVFRFNGGENAVDHIALFWIGASLLALLCALTVWNVKPREREGGNSQTLPCGEAWYNPTKSKMGFSRMAAFPSRRDGKNILTIKKNA